MPGIFLHRIAGIFYNTQGVIASLQGKIIFFKKEKSGVV